MATKKAIKLPKSIGACADKLYEVRQKRLEMQRLVDELAYEESFIKNHIIDTLPKSDTGASGKIARVSVVTKQVPQVKDWDQLYKYIKRTGQFDLIQRRLSPTAVRDRWDDGKKIPGVESFGAVSVSLTKV